MEEAAYLILDQGGHSSRAVIMDGSGAAFRADRPLGTSRPRDGFVEHDPGELLESLYQSIEEAADNAGHLWDRVRSAGLATQRSSIVCWDAGTSKPLTPVISWQDTRARDGINRVAGRIDDIHRRTGLYLSAHYGVSKFQWCLENILEVKRAGDEGRLCMGPMSSYIIWNLTKEKRFLVDPVNASRTLLWNIHSRKWDEELLKLFHIHENLLPVCVQTIHEFGSLAIKGRTIPLKLVTGDQSAALYASGDLDTETAYINVGTGAFVSRSTGNQPVFSRGLLTSMINEQGRNGDFVLEGTVNGAGSAISWIQEACAVKNIQEEIHGWLNEVKTPPLFLNGVSGLGSPYWQPDFPVRFLGKGTVPEKAAAVVESIVFLLNRNMVEMEKSIEPASVIRITGGMSKVDGLCQKLADLTRTPVYRSGETEATVRGACYLLAGTPADWSKIEHGRRFEPEDGRGISQRYENWVEEMEKRIKTVNGEQ